MRGQAWASRPPSQDLSAGRRKACPNTFSARWCVRRGRRSVTRIVQLSGELLVSHTYLVITEYKLVPRQNSGKWYCGWKGTLLKIAFGTSVWGTIRSPHETMDFSGGTVELRAVSKHIIEVVSELDKCTMDHSRSFDTVDDSRASRPKYSRPIYFLDQQVPKLRLQCMSSRSRLNLTCMEINIIIGIS